MVRAHADRGQTGLQVPRRLLDRRADALVVERQDQVIAPRQGALSRPRRGPREPDAFDHGPRLADDPVDVQQDAPGPGDQGPDPARVADVRQTVILVEADCGEDGIGEVEAC